MAQPEPDGERHSRYVQIYQIVAQTVLGVVGVGGYIALIAFVIFHSGEWTTFQQIQVAGALGFLSGTIVASVYGYAFGSSFGSQNKDAALADAARRNDQPQQ